MALVNLSFPLKQKFVLDVPREIHPNKQFPGGTADYITIHMTGNSSAGADAEAHANWMYNAADYSWHVTVDDVEAWQSIPWEMQGWHAGDGYYGLGNQESIGVEICMHKGIDQTRAYEHAAELVAHLRLMGHGTRGIKQHNDWTGKDCPQLIRRDGLWWWFLERVTTYEWGAEVTRAEYEDLVLAFLAGSEEKDEAGKVKSREERLKVGLWRVKQIAEGKEQSIGDRARSAITLVKNHVDNHGASPEIAGLKKDLANHRHDHQHDVEVKFK